MLSACAAPAPIQPSPSATPEASTPALLVNAEYGPDGSIVAGRYAVDDPFPVSLALDVPSGWETWTVEEQSAGLLVTGDASSSGWGLFFVTIDGNLFADPCDVAAGMVASSPGPEVEDLVQAIAALPRLEAAEPLAIEIDGHGGTQLVVTAPQDAADCPDGAATVWSIPGWEDVNYRMSLGQPLTFRVLEVNGTRLVIVSTEYEETSAWEERLGVDHDPAAHRDDVPELESMIESITFGNS
jgi:hypothetical protein